MQDHLLRQTDEAVRLPLVWKLMAVCPAAIAVVVLVIVSGRDSEKTSLPVHAIQHGVFYLTPVICIYTIALLAAQKQKNTVDFWMTTMFASIPLVILGGYFLFGLLMSGFAGDGVP